MSGLLVALHRLEGCAAEAAAPVAPSQFGSSPAAPSESASSNKPGDLASALIAACSPPALIAAVGIGVEESFAPLLRETAEKVARRIGRDVVLLGPGLLDDGATLISQWSALRKRADYGFLHAPAEYVAGRLDGLGCVDAVVPVVELGRTSPRAVQAFRQLLADHGIGMLGAVVIGDEFRGTYAV